MVLVKNRYPVGGLVKGKFQGHETFPKNFEGSEISPRERFLHRIAKMSGHKNFRLNLSTKGKECVIAHSSGTSNSGGVK